MSKEFYNVEILADSEFQPKGKDGKPYPKIRITTMELTYPRCIHSEFMTHRTHSRNAASSRAIPVMKQLSKVYNKPFIPFHWGKNKKGMQATEELSGFYRWFAIQLWSGLRYPALFVAWLMVKLGVHKQIANRLIEPWSWITVIATANEDGWSNFFKLRCHKDAEPHFQKIAFMARNAMRLYTPSKMKEYEWHLPLIRPIDWIDANWDQNKVVKVCIGRCARVSYETHDGVRDLNKDIILHDDLSKKGHWSPFEHACRFVSEAETGGNLGPHVEQYRKRFEKEFVRAKDYDYAEL